MPDAAALDLGDDAAAAARARRRASTTTSCPTRSSSATSATATSSSTPTTRARATGRCARSSRRGSASGAPVVLEIEVQGARQVRETMPEAIQVFIAPPSLDALRARLVGRGTDAPEQVEARLRTAERELAAQDEFARVVVNDRLEHAVEELVAVVAPPRRMRRSERLGIMARMPEVSYAVILTRDAERANSALRSIADQAPDAELLLVLNEADDEMRALARGLVADGARILHDGVDVGVVCGLEPRAARGPRTSTCASSTRTASCSRAAPSGCCERCASARTPARSSRACCSATRRPATRARSCGATEPTSRVASLPADVHAVDYATVELHARAPRRRARRRRVRHALLPGRVRRHVVRRRRSGRRVARCSATGARRASTASGRWSTPLAGLVAARGFAASC